MESHAFNIKKSNRFDNKSNFIYDNESNLYMSSDLYNNLSNDANYIISDLDIFYERIKAFDINEISDINIFNEIDAMILKYNNYIMSLLDYYKNMPYIQFKIFDLSKKINFINIHKNSILEIMSILNNYTDIVDKDIIDIGIESIFENYESLYNYKSIPCIQKKIIELKNVTNESDNEFDNESNDKQNISCTQKKIKESKNVNNDQSISCIAVVDNNESDNESNNESDNKSNDKQNISCTQKKIKESKNVNNIQSISCIAVGDNNGYVTIWNSITYEIICSYRHHFGAINVIKFHPDGNKIASGDIKGNIILICLDTLMPILTLKKVHIGKINSINFSANSTLVLSSGDDNVIKLHDTKTGILVHEIYETDQITKTIITPNCKMIISCSKNGTIKMYSSRTYKLVYTLTTSSVNIIDISFDSRYIASAGPDNNYIEIYEKADEGKITRILLGHTREINDIKFTVDNSKIISSSRDNTIKIYDCKSGIVLNTLIDHKKQVTCINILNDNRIISGSIDKTIKIWDIETGLLQKTLIHTSAIYCITSNH
jgi:WD40 repeat protein